MEDALAEYLLSPVLGLPYWDWTEPWDHSTPLIGDMTHHDKNNPWSFSFNSVLQKNTFREASFFNTTQYRDIVDENICKRQFLRFSTPVENLHVAIHGAVGGDMATVSYASMDPMFFLHHSQVEKVFREYYLCQEEYFSSNWIETLPKSILDQPLECFQIPNFNKNRKTFNQTISSVLQNRNTRCYEYETNKNENLKCRRDCRGKADNPARFLVFNMAHIETSGKLSLDLCLTCRPGSCGTLGTLQIDYFGFGSRMVNNTERNHPYYIDITDYLKGYKGYSNNATWLATVPIETRVLSFKEYRGEKDLPLYWINTFSYSVYQKSPETEEMVQLNWNQPYRNTIVKDEGTSVGFVDGCDILEEALEFEDEAAYEQCDQSKLKLVKLPAVPPIGDHFYYRNLTAPSCTKMDKLHVQIRTKL